MKLEGKSAIVTRSGIGVGREIALALAREGADVLVSDRELDGLQQTVAMIEELGRRGVAVVTESFDESQVNVMVQAALENFGKVDFLINNGSITGPTQNLTALEIAERDNVITANLTEAFLCTKAVLPQMLERGAGKIVNIGSEPVPADNDNRTLNASWGILDFSATLAQELGPHNIQVNTIRTGSAESRIQAKDEEVFVQGTALKRLLDPEQIASAVVIFCSAEGDNISGQAFEISARYAL